MITIHWDFSDGTEVSYREGIGLISESKSFNTHCLEFFSNDVECEVLVMRKDGRTLIKSDLEHIFGKEIRNEHNLQKMLQFDSFIWK